MLCITEPLILEHQMPRQTRPKKCILTSESLKGGSWNENTCEVIPSIPFRIEKCFLKSFGKGKNIFQCNVKFFNDFIMYQKILQETNILLILLDCKLQFYFFLFFLTFYEVFLRKLWKPLPHLAWRGVKTMKLKKYFFCTLL